MDTQNQRLTAFEAWARTACGMPAGTPLNWGAVWTKDSWVAWNAALDSVVIELPDTVANTGTLTSTAVLGYKRECREAIEAAGLRVKV